MNSTPLAVYHSKANQVLFPELIVGEIVVILLLLLSSYIVIYIYIYIYITPYTSLPSSKRSRQTGPPPPKRSHESSGRKPATWKHGLSKHGSSIAPTKHSQIASWKAMFTPTTFAPTMFHVASKGCAPELARVNIHWRIPGSIHWSIPVKSTGKVTILGKCRWTSEKPLEKATELWRAIFCP